VTVPVPVAAVDVGGTRIKAAVVRGARAEGLVVAPVDDSSSVFDQVSAVVASLSAQAGGAVQLGICVPGLVDASSGVVRRLEGKLAELDGTDVGTRVAELCGIVPVVTNDAVAFGIGEAVHGAGAEVQRVVVVTIGTGVGVSLVDRSLPVEHWLRATATLGGFIPISSATSGPVDSTGRPGTIEALCCAVRILDHARDAGGDYGSVEAILAAAARGESAAVRGLATYRDDLVRALVALTHAHMPDAIVIGGGPLHHADTLLEGVEPRVNERLYAGYSVSVRAAALGDSAALVGLGVVAGRRP
jgi:glucokinase